MISFFIPSPIGYWEEGELGERLRGVPGGGEAMWERGDLFIEVNSRCGRR